MSERYHVTAEVLEVLRLLARYRFLRSSFIVALTGRNERGCKATLTRLKRRGYVRLPKEQHRAYNTLWSPDIYEITESGREVLRTRGIKVQVAANLPDKKGDKPDREFGHSMMICDFVASVEIGCKREGLRFISSDEVREKAGIEGPIRIPYRIRWTFPDGRTEERESEAIPDELYGIGYPNGDASFFALEASHFSPPYRSTLRKSSDFRKVLAYRDITKRAEPTEEDRKLPPAQRPKRGYRGQLDIPNLRVIFVAPDQGSVQAIIRQIAKVSSSSNLFLATAVPVQELTLKAVPPFPDVLHAPMLRAGMEPTSLLPFPVRSVA